MPVAATIIIAVVSAVMLTPIASVTMVPIAVTTVAVTITAIPIQVGAAGTSTPITKKTINSELRPDRQSYYLLYCYH